jgi:hypothetical protein
MIIHALQPVQASPILPHPPQPVANRRRVWQLLHPQEFAQADFGLQLPQVI